MKCIQEDIYLFIDESVDTFFRTPDMNHLVKRFILERKVDGPETLHLAYIHFKAAGGIEGSHAVKILAAAELLNLAIDILDDLQDGDNLRKVWATMDRGAAINIASALLILGQHLILTSELDTDHLHPIQTMVNCLLLKAGNGQHKDLSNLKELEEEDYFEMASEKSGSVFAMTCALGVAASQKNINLYPFIQYGTYLGIASQLANDLRDVSQLTHKSDLLSKKYTLPIKFLLDSCHIKDNPIRDYYDNLISFEELLGRREAVKKVIQESRVKVYCEFHALKYLNRALNLLDQMEHGHLDKQYLGNAIQKYFTNYIGGEVSEGNSYVFSGESRDY